MFGRKKPPQDPPHNPLWELRQKLLEQPPEDAASLAPPGTSVWGVLIETGYDQGPVSMLVVGDGTASLYYPNGGGVLGAGLRPAVRAASTALLITADAQKDAAAPAGDFAFPARGRVRIFLLTTGGVLAAEGEERAVAQGATALGSIFHAGQAVLSQIRIVAQQGEGG